MIFTNNNKNNQNVNFHLDLCVVREFEHFFPYALTTEFSTPIPFGTLHLCSDQFSFSSTTTEPMSEC